jgi:Fe-S-cluster containining protein
MPRAWPATTQRAKRTRLKNHRQPGKPPHRTDRLRFECTQCGRCCTRRDKYAHVYVEPEEVRALAALLGVAVREFRRRFTFVDELGWTQIEFANDTCPFLDVASNRCTVYEARPVQCRTFPFWDDMIDGRGWTKSAKAMCEGLGRGEVVPKAEVERNMREMREWE